MIRLAIFLVGFVLFLAGAASNYQTVQLPFDLRSVTCSIGFAVFTLDVIFMVVGVFLVLVAWLFHRINQT